MYKEIFNILNHCLVLSFFIVNILFILMPVVDYKQVLIVETIYIPFIHLLTFILVKVSDKE